MKYGFIIDNRKCIGCHACTTACKSEHDVPVGVFRTWVKQVEKGEFPNTRRVFSVMRCNHCTDAPCVEICPVEALYFRPDGIVDFDKNRCIGCKSCMQACPYDALYIDPDTHTAAKCNYCAHRVDIGLEPACVNVCPEHAIISGDMDNPETKISQLLGREQVTVRKAAKGTVPNLFYIDGDEASLNPIATEKPSITLWGAQTRGVGHFAKQTEKLAYDGDSLITALADGITTSVQDLKENGPQKSIDVLMNGSVRNPNSETRNPNRVYDAPDKGLLWGWEVSAYVWTKAIATGAFLVPFIAAITSWAVIDETTQWLGIALGLVFLGLTGALLVKDLDRPDRFLNVLLRPQWKSWLAKGGYAIAIYGLSLTLLGVSMIFDLEPLMDFALWSAAIFAVLVAVYTAFLFAQAKGRDFWQSPALALHMLIHSLLAGAAVFAFTGLVSNLAEDWSGFLRTMMIVMIALNLLTTLVELSINHSTQEAKMTADMITKGRYSRLFWWGVVLFGNIVPFIALLSGLGFRVQLAGVLALVGIYFTEKIWVEAPQRIQLS